MDKSVFIDFLRQTTGFTLLEELFLDDRVVLSHVVKLELLAGVRRSERFRLTKVLAPLRLRASFPSVGSCESLLKRARGSGLLGGIPDIMILADAVEERCSLATKDTKLLRLAEFLGVPTVEV